MDKDAWHGIQGWFNYSGFYRNIANRLQSGQIAVEVGVYFGRSVIFLSSELKQRGKDVKVFAVDHWVKDEDYNLFLSNLDETGVRNMVYPLREKSVVGAQCFADESLDFVYIDAEHHYEAVLADVIAWLPKMKPGGIISGHDFDFPGVKRAVSELFPGSLFFADGNVWYAQA